MKKIVLIAAVAALSACNQNKAEPAPASQAKPGTYSVTEIDGTKMTSVLAGDHTYTNTVHGQRTEAGAWAIVGGKTCFTPSEGTGAYPRCYVDSPLGEDGTFTATPDRGEPITVKKIA